MKKDSPPSFVATKPMRESAKSALSALPTLYERVDAICAGVIICQHASARHFGTIRSEWSACNRLLLMMDSMPHFRLP
jgi:hypothetical protein